jgi:hypothetical protein
VLRAHQYNPAAHEWLATAIRIVIMLFDLFAYRLRNTR